MATSYTDVVFSNLGQGGITATKLNKLRDDLSTAISAGGGGGGTGDMTKAVYDTNANGKVDTCDSVPWGSVTGAPSTFAPSAHQASHVSGIDQIPSAGTSVRGLMPQANGNPNGFYASDGSQKQVMYTNLGGSQPGPTAHQASHVTGTDQIPSATTVVRGLMPIANNVANNFYASDATQKQVTYAMLGGTQPAPIAHAPSHLDNGSDVIPVVTSIRTGLTPKLSGNAATFLDGTGVFSTPAGGVDPGTWTNLILGTGWTAPTQAQYRVEVNGAVSTVYFRGMIQGAYSVIGTTAFTLAVGARPSMTRTSVLGGAQNTGMATDVSSYIASVASSGVCTIYFLGAGPFIWADPTQVQQVFLDGLFYSL